jgi:hypothetical protein
LPGRYAIRIIVGSDTAGASVDVLPDPRYDIPAADRRAKDDAVMAIGRQLEHGAEAADRLKEARDDLSDIAERLTAAKDSASTALAEQARALHKALGSVRAKLTGPEGLQGIIRDDSAAIPALNQVLYRMLSSWDAPTEAQRLEAEAAASRLREAVEATNRVFEQDVAAFRTQLEAAGFALLPVKPAIEM